MKGGPTVSASSRPDRCGPVRYVNALTSLRNDGEKINLILIAHVTNFVHLVRIFVYYGDVNEDQIH